MKSPVVYFIQCGTNGPIKIGRSIRVHLRMESMQTGSPEVLHLLATVPGGIDVERDLHALFASDRYRGEWFRPSPALLAHVRRVRRLAPGAPVIVDARAEGDAVVAAADRAAGASR